ncbi:MAG: hypothetical protein KDI65_10700 [Alphaproteobacteria bacterium]|nr:hypothetical protein [Alphaproteobacteria bacterium]
MINKFSYLILFIAIVIYALKYQEMTALDCSQAGKDLPVEVHLEMPDPDLNTDLSYAQITQKFRNYHHGRGAGAFMQALGVTEFSMDVRFQMKYTEKRKTISGQVCLIPQKIDVMMNLAQTIYLGNPSTRSKCQFKTLMGHEMRHVKINRDVSQSKIKTFEESVRQGVASFGQYQGWGPYEASDSQAKKDLLTEYMNSSIGRAIKETEKEINGLQSKVDTPEEYLRIGRSCRW